MNKQGVLCSCDSSDTSPKEEHTHIANAIDEHVAIITQLKALEPQIAETARRMVLALRRGGKVLWMGNGGSAAESQHLAAELVGRFVRERRGLASLALTSDTSLLTSVANDYSFEHVFRRQVEALCGRGDVVIAMSTSGHSANVLAGLCAARRIGAFTVVLTGQQGLTVNTVDVCIRVPSQITARIQEAHILIGHLLCDWVDSEFDEGHVS